MNSSPISHQTSARGFTLTELLVSLVLVGAVGLMTFSVLTSTMKLSTQNVVTNVSNSRARQTIDRLGEIARYAQDTPVLINADGSVATGTSSDGLLLKNSLGGPYIFKHSSGVADTDIQIGDTSFVVEYAVGAGASAPKAGDYFLLNLSTQPELEVATVSTPTTSGSISRVTITTTQGIAEKAKPGSYTVNAGRFRKEAYVFVQSGSYFTLRRYPKVTASMSYTSAANYKEIGTGFQKLGTQPWFTKVTDTGTQAIWLRAIARSSSRSEYAEKITGKNTLTTMPLQVKLWNYNAPPPPAT